jgi:hypothetical protein
MSIQESDHYFSTGRTLFVFSIPYHPHILPDMLVAWLTHGLSSGSESVSLAEISGKHSQDTTTIPVELLPLM